MAGVHPREEAEEELQEHQGPAEAVEVQRQEQHQLEEVVVVEEEEVQHQAEVVVEPTGFLQPRAGSQSGERQPLGEVVEEQRGFPGLG